MTQSADAYTELLHTLAEVGRRFAGEEWMITDPDEVAEALAVTLQHLATGLETQFDEDPAHPSFRPIVTAWRKALGDNADARYHDARVDPAGTYRVRGNVAGAVYVSFTVEAAAGDGSFPTATLGVVNDTDLDVGADGSFELVAGGPERPGPWLPLPGGAARITVRHYWEQADTPWRPPVADLGLAIDLVDGYDAVVSRPPAPTDESTAAAIRRMATYVRSRTVDLIPRPGEGEPPAFVSRVPHEFPAPVPPGDHALAAADAAYSMAPYLLAPDEALVMTVRWPACRCANVSLWNRQMQTLDYLRGTVSLNRAQTLAEADGTVRIVVSHRDPGVPNWLSTEGRPFGLVYWRFMLPEGPIATPAAVVVPVDALRG
jgi:hypothetical protein